MADARADSPPAHARGPGAMHLNIDPQVRACCMHGRPGWVPAACCTAERQGLDMISHR